MFKMPEVLFTLIMSTFVFMKIKWFINVIFMIKFLIIKGKWKSTAQSMARANLNKDKCFLTSAATAWKYILKRPRICINWNPPFRPHFIFQKKFSFLCIVKQKKKKFWSDPKIFDFQKSLSKLGPTVEDFNSSWFWLLRGSPFTLW